MSFDPNQPNYYPPPHPEALAALARGRVQIPGILLIGVGLLNLVGAALLVGGGFFFTSIPLDKFEQLVREQQPQQWEQLEKQGWTTEGLLRVYVVGGYSSGAVTGILGLLILIGGIRMLALRSYGLAMFASIVAAVPCLSPSGCCLLGEIVGVWALIVLLDGEVRSAFR